MVDLCIGGAQSSRFSECHHLHGLVVSERELWPPQVEHKMFNKKRLTDMVRTRGGRGRANHYRRRADGMCAKAELEDLRKRELRRRDVSP